MKLTKITTELHKGLTISFLANFHFSDGAIVAKPIDVNLFSITDEKTGITTHFNCSAEDSPYELTPYKSSLQYIQGVIVGEFNTVPGSIHVKWNQ